MPIVLVPILGTGKDEVMAVSYFAGYLRGPDGRCAYCHGDPTGEGDPQSAIARFLARNTGADTCPVCSGQAT